MNKLSALTEALRLRKLQQEAHAIPTIPPANPNAPAWKDQFPSTSSPISALQRLKARLNTQKEEIITDEGIDVANLPLSNPKESEQTTDKYGNLITYNQKQADFIDLAGKQRKSAILIGAAGTGKTTTQKGVVQAIIESDPTGRIGATDHKHLVQGNPGIIICAYTRRAVANIRKNVSADVQANCITIHKLLEYQPVYYTVMDDVSGEERTKMVFEATRNAENPLPSSIHTIIFEESSMLGVDLYKEVINACLHPVQIIFLGDIQQLPPVFGPAILGFKLLELQTIELTDVYRQALESPIIALAHRILSGKGISAEEFPAWKFPGKMTIHPWKKKISSDDALYTAGQFFTTAFDKGVYNPEEDIILLPFNKAFGTIELNNLIANHLARARKAITYEIIAGFQKVYLSIGDKVLYDKEDATVISIDRNPSYAGAEPTMHSTTLDYWGHDPESSGHDSNSSVDVDFLLAAVSSAQSEDRVNQASHILTLRMNDSEQEIRIQSAGEINSLLLGYALTVHKSQGSEWRKVYFVCHSSHATMLQRELLYTAITRAREELYIICEPDTFVKGITSQRVKGDTLEEKAEFFKGKVTSGFDTKGL